MNVLTYPKCAVSKVISEGESFQIEIYSSVLSTCTCFFQPLMITWCSLNVKKLNFICVLYWNDSINMPFKVTFNRHKIWSVGKNIIPLIDE